MPRGLEINSVRGFALAAAFAGAAALAGCASVSQVGAQPSCTAVSPGASLTISDADTGRQYCVQPGTSIDVLLHGSKDALWSAPHPDSAALQAAPNGRGMLALGVTGGFFRSAAAGTVHLTAFRAPCTATATPAAACDVAHSFQVTITVR